VSHASMVAMNHLLLLLLSNNPRPICCCHGCLWWFNLFTIEGWPWSVCCILLMSPIKTLNSSMPNVFYPGLDVFDVSMVAICCMHFILVVWSRSASCGTSKSFWGNDVNDMMSLSWNVISLRLIVCTCNYAVVMQL
jgi:hypothetical protein